MLETERQQIDAIDREIIHLYEKRTRIVEQVVRVKLENHLPVLDANREQIVIEKVQSYLEDPLLANDVAALYIEIMRLSRQHQATWLSNHKD